MKLFTKLKIKLIRFLVPSNYEIILKRKSKDASEEIKQEVKELIKRQV